MADDKKPQSSSQPSLSEDQRRKIADALEKKGATGPCPRCGQRQFSVLEGYFIHPISTSASGLRIGGPAVPVAVIACNNCGFLSEHALGALGLLEREAEK